MDYKTFIDDMLENNIKLDIITNLILLIEEKRKVNQMEKNKIDNEKLLTFMDVVDLKKLSTRLKIPSEKHRTALESSLVSVSNSNLRLGVEQSLERKFEDVTKTFNEETSCKSISKKDLKTLSRFSEQREVEKKKLKQKVEFWNNIDQHVSDLSHFLKSATSA